MLIKMVIQQLSDSGIQIQKLNMLLFSRRILWMINPNPILIWGRGAVCVYSRPIDAARWLPERLIKQIDDNNISREKGVLENASSCFLQKKKNELDHHLDDIDRGCTRMGNGRSKLKSTHAT